MSKLAKKWRLLPEVQEESARRSQSVSPQMEPAWPSPARRTRTKHTWRIGRVLDPFGPIGRSASPYPKTDALLLPPNHKPADTISRYCSGVYPIIALKSLIRCA